MTAHHDDAPAGADDENAGNPSAFDLDDAQFEQFAAELQRIFGATAGPGDADRPSRQMMWVLPAPTFDEAMVLLRQVPSGSGEAGLNALLLERFPALADATDDDLWADEPAAGDEDGAGGNEGSAPGAR
jgi:hypothetical protein